MLELTAVFESWHIGDGNYPPLHDGMLVNLSFQLEPEDIELVDASSPLFLEHRGGAAYDFCAEVLRVYNREDTNPLAILSTGAFRYYIETAKARNLTTGLRVQGQGTLLLDYYVWVEYIAKYSDPPDIFFALEVIGIRKVEIPESFIHRHDKGKSHPTRVAPADFGTITDLSTMEGQKFDEEFYLINFRESSRPDIPRTFL